MLGGVANQPILSSVTDNRGSFIVPKTVSRFVLPLIFSTFFRFCGSYHRPGHLGISVPSVHLITETRGIPGTQVRANMKASEASELSGQWTSLLGLHGTDALTPRHLRPMYSIPKLPIDLFLLLIIYTLLYCFTILANLDTLLPYLGTYVA